MFDQHPNDTCSVTRAVMDRLFENAEWRVLADGLEHRATGYFIARETIAMRRGDLWEWPLHLAEKTWCTPRSFRQAFLAAVNAFDSTADASLDRSFAAAFGLVSGAGGPAASAAGTQGFVALADVLRPKSVSPGPARKRVGGSEPRGAIRRTGTPVPLRAGDAPRQRVTL